MVLERSPTRRIQPEADTAAQKRKTKRDEQIVARAFLRVRAMCLPEKDYKCTYPVTLTAPPAGAAKTRRASAPPAGCGEARAAGTGPRGRRAMARVENSGSAITDANST